MSRREDIDSAVWSDPDFAELGAAAKLLYLWSFTNERCGMGGIYKVPKAAIALETSLGVAELDAALEELAAGRFLFYDGSWLWVRSRIKHLRTRTVQMCRGVAKDVAKVPDSHPFREQLMETSGSSVWASGDRATTIAQELADITTGLPGTHPDVPGYHPAVEGASPNKGSHPRTSQRFKGKGYGKGTGKGPLGRGAGRGTGGTSVKPARVTEAEAWATEHFPTVRVDEVLLVARQVHEDGFEVNPQTVGARLAETHPDLAGGIAA